MTIEQFQKSFSTWATSKGIILRAWLFGSRARGMEREESDWDVAISTLANNSIIINASIWENELTELIYSNYSELIKVHLCTYDGKNTPIVQKALDEGSIELFEYDLPSGVEEYNQYYHNYDFFQIISDSLRQINDSYFRLPTTYDQEGIIRERVFCYEFYHRIRSKMNMEKNTLLTAEIDKRGHKGFDIEDWRNPDFILHIPGTYNGNSFVIEVKGDITNKAGIKKDFSTLFMFVEKYEYEYGIFVLFNHSLDELLVRYDMLFKELCSNDKSNQIYIMAIKEPDTEVECVSLNTIFT